MRLLTVLFLVFALASCSRQQTGSPESKTFELVKIDSVDFKILGEPILADVTKDGKQFLIYDFPSGEIISFDQEGQLLGRFSKKEDTPDAFGFMLELPAFLEKNEVIVNGMRGIFLYDLTGNQQQRIDHPESLGGAAFMPMPGKSIETAKWKGEAFLLSKSVRTRDTYAGEDAFYERFRALEWVNVSSGQSQEIIPFEPGSLFLNGNGFILSDYTPALEWINDRLFIALGADPRLSVYNYTGENFQLDTTLVLSIPEFLDLPPKGRHEIQEGTIILNGGTPAIRNIHQSGDKLLVSYFGGIEEEKENEAMRLWESGNEEEASLLFEKNQEEAAKGLLVFDQQTLAYLGTCKLPLGVDTEGFSSSDQLHWFQKKSSEVEEEDFIRLYAYKLIEK